MARVGRVIQGSLLGLLGVLVIAFVVLWLMVAAKPEEWLAQQARGAEEIRELASQFKETATWEVQNKLAHGEPVAATFTAAAITAALAQSLRAEEIPLPEGVSEPLVVFQRGRALVMARLQYGAIETVVTAELAPTVRDGHLRVDVAALRAGALPLPKSVLDPLMDRLRARIQTLQRRAEQASPEDARKAADELEWLQTAQTLLEGGSVDTARLPGLRRDGYHVKTIGLREGEVYLEIVR